MLLRSAGLLGLSVPTVSILLAACGGDDDDDPTATGAAGEPTNTTAAGQPTATTATGEPTATMAAGEPTATGAAGEPTATTSGEPVGEGTPGGTLVFGLLRDPIGFDPHINYGASSSSLQGNIYDTLIDYAEDGSLTGSLAEQWEVSDDGLNYTFTLREGVVYQGGEPFTAEDVVFNFDRILDEATGATRRAELSNMGAYEATDEMTVAIEMPAPYATLLAVLATPEVAIASKSWLESGVDPVTEMNGTGPFTLDSFEPEVKYTLVKNPEYWKPGLPYLDSIEQVPILDDNARMNALRSGDINFVEYVPWQNMAELEGDSNYTLWKGFDLYNIVRLNPNIPPLDNPLVRQALNYAMDREAIIAVAFGGEGLPMTAGLFPPASPWYNQELDGHWSYDPDLAMELLTQAGVDPSTITLDFTAATISVHMDTAQVVAQQLEDLGFTVNIIQQDVPSLTERRTTGDYQLMQDGLSLSYPDPDAYSVYFAIDGASYARGVNYENQELNDLLDQGRSEIDEAQRKATYAEFEAALFEDAPWLFLLFRPQAEAGIAGIQGYVRIPGLGLRSEAFMENIWIEQP
jgi:peptide/nickel transport system substrate-binding protein/glutathione transport system substrate-binding protein